MHIDLLQFEDPDEAVAAWLNYTEKKDASTWYRMLRHHWGDPHAYAASVSAACEVRWLALDRVRQAEVRVWCARLLERKINPMQGSQL